MVDAGSILMWAVVAGIVATLVVVLICRPSKTSSYLAAPLMVQACIFSFDDGTQSWAKVLTLLGELRQRGFHLALATSAPRSVFEAKMAELPEVLESVDAIVTGNEIGSAKPSPDLFVEAARRLRCDPTRCVVFDEAVEGITGAQTAQMLTAAVGPGVHARFRHLTPDWLLRDISAFDHRDIELPRGLLVAEQRVEEDEVPALVAIARLMPNGSALQRCLMGTHHRSSGEYGQLGV